MTKTAIKVLSIQEQNLIFLQNRGFQLRVTCQLSHSLLNHRLLPRFTLGMLYIISIDVERLTSIREVVALLHEDLWGSWTQYINSGGGRNIRIRTQGLQGQPPHQQLVDEVGP